MEAFYSRPNESVVGREVNLGIQRGILRAMKVIVKDVKNYDARASLSLASIFANSGYHAIGMSGDGNVHNIEHALSAYNEKVIHGEGIAVIALQYYPWLYRKKPELKPVFEEWALGLFGTSNVEEAFKLHKELYASWKAPRTLKDLGVPKEAIPEIVKTEEFHRQFGRVGKWWRLTNEDTTEILTLAAE